MQEIKQTGDYCPECSALAAQGVWEGGTHHYRHNGKHELTIECRPLTSPTSEPAESEGKRWDDCGCGHSRGQHAGPNAEEYCLVCFSCEGFTGSLEPSDALPLEDASVLTQAAEYLDHRLTGPEALIAISVMASFAEQYAAKILESERPEIERKAVEQFIEKLLWFAVFSKDQIKAMRSVAKEMNGEPKKCA